MYGKDGIFGTFPGVDGRPSVGAAAVVAACCCCSAADPGGSGSASVGSRVAVPAAENTDTIRQCVINLFLETCYRPTTAPVDDVTQAVAPSSAARLPTPCGSGSPLTSVTMHAHNLKKICTNKYMGCGHPRMGRLWSVTQDGDSAARPGLAGPRPCRPVLLPAAHMGTRRR
jgi:hypothetical protein